MNESFTLGRGLRQWWRDARRQRGPAGALGRLLADLWGVARDLTPARRRLRFGDLDYDWEHGVNTTWANPSLGTRLREVLAGRQYMPTEPELFRRLIGELAINYEQYTFVDLGCGKGRALLLASEFPFCRIIGVELLPELCRIAEENVRVFQQGAQRRRIELWRGDARRFAFPSEPLVIFLFDPFPELVLDEVLGNLRRSVEQNARDVLLVYQNPISEHVLSGAGWLQRLGGDVTAAVYRAHLPLG